jgi:hypothetical protein
MPETKYRDAKGRIKKGAPALFKGLPKPLEPPPDASFDDDIIHAANSFGHARARVGRIAWLQALMQEKPSEYATLLTRALARKAEEQAANAIGISGVTVVHVGSIPHDCYVEGDLMRLQQAALWPDPPPPSKPVLVVDEDAGAFVDDDDAAEDDGVDDDDAAEDDGDDAAG